MAYHKLVATTLGLGAALFGLIRAAQDLDVLSVLMRHHYPSLRLRKVFRRQLKMGSVLRLGIMLIASGLPTFASPLLEGRAKCNRDNLLRCYDPTGTKATDSASRSAATAFCSSYLSVPVVTSIVATSTPLRHDSKNILQVTKCF